MNADPVWLPAAALVGLTVLVWIKLYVDRIGEMRAKRIDAQELATARAAAGRLEHIGAADNFRNLFEIPVLFYLLCVTLVLTGGSTPGFVAAAWVYVALRTVHSLIHVSYNRVMHRFTVYIASTLLLVGMWAAFLPRLLR